MTGFIEPNAANLLGFQCKPIRGHAGGKITTGEMMENSHCFQVRAHVCTFIRLSVILSNVDNCHRSVCAKTMALGLLLSLRLELFTSVLCTLGQIMLTHCFPLEILKKEKPLSGDTLICKTTGFLYKHLLNRSVLTVCRHLYTAIVTSWQLHACQTQMPRHVKMLTKM